MWNILIVNSVISIPFVMDGPLVRHFSVCYLHSQISKNIWTITLVGTLFPYQIFRICKWEYFVLLAALLVSVITFHPRICQVSGQSYENGYELQFESTVTLKECMVSQLSLPLEEPRRWSELHSWVNWVQCGWSVSVDNPTQAYCMKTSIPLRVFSKYLIRLYGLLFICIEAPNLFISMYNWSKGLLWFLKRVIYKWLNILWRFWEGDIQDQLECNVSITSAEMSSSQSDPITRRWEASQRSVRFHSLI